MLDYEDKIRFKAELSAANRRIANLEEQLESKVAMINTLQFCLNETRKTAQRVLSETLGNKGDYII